MWKYISHINVFLIYSKLYLYYKLNHNKFHEYLIKISDEHCIIIKFIQFLTSINYFETELNEKLKKFQYIYPKVEPIDENKIKHIPYKHIESNPIGCGTIGQVFRCTLDNDVQVAIKILKNNVYDNFLLYKHIYLFILSTIFYFDKYKQNILHTYIEEFSKNFDFENECMIMDYFYNIDTNVTNVYIPKLYKDYCRKDVIVMEFVKGKTVTETYLKRCQYRIISNFVKTSLFHYDYFHNDLHPGNIIISEDDRIYIIDFGMSSINDDKTRDVFSILTHINKSNNYNFIRLNIQLRESLNNTKCTNYDEVYKYLNDFLKDKSNIEYRYQFMQSLIKNKIFNLRLEYYQVALHNLYSLKKYIK